MNVLAAPDHGALPGVSLLAGTPPVQRRRQPVSAGIRHGAGALRAVGYSTPGVCRSAPTFLRRLPTARVGANIGELDMAVDDAMRLRIHRKLTELMGSEEADAMVGSLLPVPWRDVATKDDLRVLSAELRAAMHEAIASQTRWLIGFVAVWRGLLLAAARLMFCRRARGRR